MDPHEDALDAEVGKNGKHVKSVAEHVAAMKVFQEAGAVLLRRGPGGLRNVEKARKRHFVRHGEAGANRAVEIRGQQALSSGEEAEHRDEEARRRRMFMTSSRDLDRGCLSKFGEGDGSFWDR